jgi:hypothetical protein
MSSPERYIASARLVIVRYGFDALHKAYRSLSPVFRCERVTRLFVALAQLEAEIERDPDLFGSPVMWEEVGRAIEDLSKGQAPKSIDSVMAEHARRSR